MALLPLRGRARSLASLSMIAVATFATVATSKAAPEIDDTARGASFELDPRHPSFSAVYSFHASETAFDGADGVWLAIEHTEIWTGVDMAIDPSIAVEVRKTSSTADEPSKVTCRGAGCVGTYETTFSWPDRLTAGSVRVSWEVFARVVYEDRLPSDARVDVTIDRTDQGPAPAVRFYEESLEFHRVVRVHARRVEVRSDAAVMGAISVERNAVPVPEPKDGVTVLVIEENRSPAVLPAGSAMPLHVPGRCATAPCGFAFRIVATSTNPDRRDFMSVTWGISTSDDDAVVRATVSDDRIPVLRESVSLRPSSVRGSVAVLANRIGIRMTGEALPADEFGVRGVLLEGVLELDAVDPVGFPDRGSIRVDVGSPGFAKVPGSYVDGWDIAEPIPVTVPTECRIEQSCKAGVVIRVRTESLSDEVELRPTITFTLSYPVTERVPRRARLAVDEEQRR